MKSNPELNSTEQTQPTNTVTEDVLVDLNETVAAPEIAKEQQETQNDNSVENNTTQGIFIDAKLINYRNL